MKRIGDKAARVLLTIFGVKTTIIIGTILTFAVILIAIITGLMGTISTSGGKGSKTNAQCVTYQKDGDEEDDEKKTMMKKTMMALSLNRLLLKLTHHLQATLIPLQKGQKPMKMPTKYLWLL